MRGKLAVALVLLALVAAGQAVSVSGRLAALSGEATKKAKASPIDKLKQAATSIKSGVIRGLSSALKTMANSKAIDLPAPLENFFIECFPTPAPGAKNCPAPNGLTALAGKLALPVLEQVKTLFKTATDAVDAKTSAENEVLSDETEQPAGARFMELPRFAPGMRWPKTGPGSLTKIAYCWDQNITWWNKIFFWWSMRIVRAASTNLRFSKVECGAAGHKIKLGNNVKKCATQAGGYNGAGNPTADTPAAAGKPSTEQYIRCDFMSFNRYSGAHEFFHALGFGHTQCRSDRNNYLDVAPAAGYQWRIIGNNVGTFDFDSVMLYPPSARGKPKTKPKAGHKGSPANMGQRSKLSAEDVRILNTVYA